MAVNIERLNEIAKPRNKKAALRFYLRYKLWIMKDFMKSWKFWTVFGIVAAIIIAAVVCHLVQPEVSYAWLEVVSGATFLLGGVAGGFIGNYLAKK